MGVDAAAMVIVVMPGAKAKVINMVAAVIAVYFVLAASVNAPIMMRAAVSVLVAAKHRHPEQMN